MVRFKNHIWTVEHVVSNLLPVALGPLIVGSHPATMWLWFRWISFLVLIFSSSLDIIPRCWLPSSHHVALVQILSPRPLTPLTISQALLSWRKNVFLCLCKYHTSICLCSMWSSLCQVSYQHFLCSLWSSDTFFLSIALLSTLNSHSGYHLPFFPSPEVWFVIQLYFSYVSIRKFNCCPD